MEDDVISFTSNGNFLCDLIKSRQFISGTPLLAKLDEVIAVEIELALIGANKAKSEVSPVKDNLRSIK